MTPVATLPGAVLAWAILLAGCAAPARRPEPPCSFSKPPYVHPRIVEDLTTWLSDSGDQVVAINVLDAQDSNRYFGDVKVKRLEGASYVYVTDGREEFGYEHVGTTASGIDVLCTTSCGGGTARFIDILLVRWEEDVGVDCDWDGLAIRPSRKRLLLRKVGEFGLGDRWSGKLEVRGNDLLIGKDEGKFAGRDWGGPLSKDPKDRTLRIDLESTDAAGDSD